MTASKLTADASAIVEWLAEVGVRWGLPSDACRIHGLLYLLASPLPTSVIMVELSMTSVAAERALDWLVEEELVRACPKGWMTEADPWLLMLQTLEKRRQRELEPALTVLKTWRHFNGTEDPVVARQAKRLLGLVEEVAAIDAGTRNFSPHTLRRMIGIGGRAARLFSGAGGRKGEI